MSITMYYGRAGSGKTRAVYERIRQVITECPGDPIILLVPEPATYRVEPISRAYLNWDALCS